MPIYEFYCPRCHTIYSFLSRKVGPAREPSCPRCRKGGLHRQVSAFAVTAKPSAAAETAGDSPATDARMEQAMDTLAREAGRMDENDPRQAADLMRRISSMTGMKLGEPMEEALRRMEAGEDPDRIEEELGDEIEKEADPFSAADETASRKPAGRKRRPPRRDPTLHEL